MGTLHWPYRVVDVDPGLRIAYVDCAPGGSGTQKGVILLIHGFPQTSYQFRNVIKPLSKAGYRVLAPDYRGAGRSSKTLTGFTKSAMAHDLVRLLDALEIDEKVHVVGHDIGGMVAFAIAARHSSRVASVSWGECPLPGTSVHEDDRTIHAVQQFHLIFHCVPDLAVALVTGRERIYLSHFFQKIAYKAAAITEKDLDYYVRSYEQPGALRCAFETYQAFEEDAQELWDWISAHGKLSVPALSLSGARSRFRDCAERMFAEVHRDGTYEIAVVPDAAHYIAEENPKGFVKEILRFTEQVARDSERQGFQVTSFTE
ncbi:alpha/beta-hydrolase [Xylariaceae sp. AK1471]|nr:alpha/beta-hydrolase [Xylariaceae sp. AK1471]